MKRFTETTKWDKPAFRKMAPRVKLLWLYLTDKCDAAGVVDLDLELASFQIGEDVSEADLKALGDWVEKLPNGRLWITKFIPFQYGELSKECKAHIPVFKLISSHGLNLDRLSIGYAKAMDSLQEKDKDKETDKEKEEGSGEKKQQARWQEKYHPGCAEVLDRLKAQSGRDYRHTEGNYKTINARLVEDGVELVGVIQMIDRQCAMWKNDAKMAEFLRVETLFGATKFESYYAAREVPLPSAQAALPATPQAPTEADLIAERDQIDAHVLKNIDTTFVGTAEDGSIKLRGSWLTGTKQIKPEHLVEYRELLARRENINARLHYTKQKPTPKIG